MDAPTYSPRLRTGVLLCGSGTAGAYQAGVLRAMAEAGVKADVLLAHGAGTITALCGAIDGGARLWEAKGPWSDPRLQRAYRWRPALRAAGWGLIAAGAVLLMPLAVLVVAAMFYAASLLASLANLMTSAAWLLNAYARTLEWLLQPPVLPTIVPRLVLLAVLIVMIVVVAAAIRAARLERTRRRFAGAFWWRLIGAPLDVREPAQLFVETLWSLVRGASGAARPPTPDEIGRRFVDVLTDNFGQPGFREVVLAVHDVDARRDLVGGVLAADARGAFDERRRGAGPRETESVDFTGVERRNLVDFLQGSLRLPVVTASHAMEFSAESYWRGELHRVCDRPELAVRLADEAANLGIEQLVVVSPAAPPAPRYGMHVRPADLRARIGEVLRSVETAALEDAITAASTRFSGVFVIRPDHNPVLPFSFAGVYDEASDRHRSLAELMQQGYDDAYRQFIEPMVATGERTAL